MMMMIVMMVMMRISLRMELNPTINCAPEEEMLVRRSWDTSTENPPWGKILNFKKIIIFLSPVVWLFVKSQVTRFPAVSLHCNSSSVHQDPLKPLKKVKKKNSIPQKRQDNNARNIIPRANAWVIEPLALKMHTKMVESTSQYVFWGVSKPLQMQHKNARIC